MEPGANGIHIYLGTAQPIIESVTTCAPQPTAGPFEDAVVSAFGPNGALARAQQGWSARTGQIEMAAAIARTIESGGSLAVEAGTGVGKTFAYLIPLLLSGRRALISTATQALQDQLFSKDIPAVSRALGLPVRVAVLKGRSSYACLHRLEQALHGPASRGPRDPKISAGLAQALQWALQSRRGDLAELDGLDERSPLRPLMTSTPDNCAGNACPRLAACHVNQARQEALQAEWVVINHHVFFSDLVLHESEGATLLPSPELVVFDEAHRLNDTGIAFLGRSLGSRQLREIAQDLAVHGPKWARGQRPWAHLALSMEQASRALATVHRPAGTAGTRLRWQAHAPDGLASSVWTRCVTDMSLALAAAEEALAATAAASAELEHLRARIELTRRLWGELLKTAMVGPRSVRWVEWGDGHQWRVVCAPTDSSHLFRHLKEAASPGTHSWLFTSATLGNDERLTWFTQGLGLEAAPALKTLRVSSPFDHAAQAAMYIPHDLPDPSDAAHAQALAIAVARWASRLGGRTLVLTTTLRAVARVAEQLQVEVTQGRCDPLRVLAQGRHSKRSMLALFRAAAEPCVLVASASFWEGVDLPGDALQLLVIDKLPFAPPDDPLMQARGEQLEALGLSAFRDAFLPEAAMALKQGAGRLIRSESDRGILVIGDRRVLTRSYGNTLLQALPDMRRLFDEAGLETAIDALVLTRSSTKARPPT